MGSCAPGVRTFAPVAAEAAVPPKAVSTGGHSRSAAAAAGTAAVCRTGAAEIAPVEATEARVTAMARALEARVGEIRTAIGEADEREAELGAPTIALGDAEGERAVELDRAER